MYLYKGYGFSTYMTSAIITKLDAQYQHLSSVYARKQAIYYQEGAVTNAYYYLNDRIMMLTGVCPLDNHIGECTDKFHGLLDEYIAITKHMQPLKHYDSISRHDLKTIAVNTQNSPLWNILLLKYPRLISVGYGWIFTTIIQNCTIYGPPSNLDVACIQLVIGQGDTYYFHGLYMKGELEIYES